MRVSVVIPCFNSLAFLPETLRSVFSQDLSSGVITDYEVLLVDDGGSDDLAGWLSDQDYPSEGSPRVGLVRQDNAGVSAARNRGVAEAQGDLIAFCDSDDLWTPHTAASLAEVFSHRPEVGMAYGWYDWIGADGRLTGRAGRHLVGDDAWESMVLHNPVSSSSVMIRREALSEVGGFAENRDQFPVDVEDWDMWIRVAADWPVACTGSVVAHIRRHAGSSSRNIESLELAYEHMMDRIFADVDEGRRALRARAVARYKVILAWESLNGRGDANGAARFLADALDAAPGLRDEREYWRLRASIAVRRLGGKHLYRLVQSSADLARRALSGR